MYKKFFGLTESPFNVNPDPRYLFVTRHTEEALACLRYGIQNRKGFVLLSGEVGTGKTTLLNKLLDQLRRERVATAFVFNSRLNVTQFFDFVMADFGIPVESGNQRTLKSQVLLRLNQWLLERYRAGETAALIIDEAQNLSPQVLEEIRLLTNLETATEKLLQIVLSGQPELENKLNQASLRQLRQRITLRCKTYPLTLDEVYGYISERLRTAGLHVASAQAGDGGSSHTEWQEVFTSDAVETLHRFSRGIPRVVNLLCEHALISAYVDQHKPIQAETVEEVAREFQLHEIEPIAPVRAPNGNGENLRLMEALQNLTNIVERLRRSE